MEAELSEATRRATPPWVSYALVACALTGAATTAVAAPTCTRRAEVRGPRPKEVAWLVKHLQSRGITARSRTGGDEGWGCPEVEIEVESRGPLLHIEARDPDGKTYVRDVTRYAVAATLIESWMESTDALPLLYVPSEWTVAMRMEAGRGTGDWWGVGAAGGLSWQLTDGLRASGNVRLSWGELLVPVTTFDTSATRTPVEKVDATIDVTVGGAAFTRAGQAIAALALTAGLRAVVGAIDVVVPLAEVTASLEIPVAQRAAIELSITSQLMPEHGPFEDGTWLTVRGGIGVTWGLE